MEILNSAIDGLFVVKSNKFQDDRGFFRESYKLSHLEKHLGRRPEFQQNNHSRSRARVLRGFHNENWDKLVYVVRGTALIVVADTRPDSTTFGVTESFVCGDDPGQHMRIFVSSGLSNAFYCFSEVDYLNEVSREFDPLGRGGFLWCDETLNVDWPDRSPIVSHIDESLPRLKDTHPNHPKFLLSAQT